MASTKILRDIWAGLMLLGWFNYMANVGIVSAISALFSGVGTILASLSTLFSSIVAIEHVGFFVMECFFWDKMYRNMRGRRTDQKEIELTRVLASNQGIYNLGTAFCLFGSLYSQNVGMTMMILITIIVYGIWGAITANKNIFFVQSVPAIVALIFTAFNSW